MPYITTTRKVKPELVLSRKGVSIYRTYDDDDVDQGRSMFYFVCAPEDSDHESYFDIRTLDAPPSGPKLSDHPPFINSRLEHDAELHARWKAWQDTGQDAAIQNHLNHLIDSGHFDKWRVLDDVEYYVRSWVTMRAMAQTTIMAANDEAAEKIARGMSPDDFCFSWMKTEDMSIEGDETFHIEAVDGDDDPIEIDMRRPAEPFSWDAVHLVKRLASLTTPEDEFNDPDNGHKANYASVDEYIADLSDERLTGEYETFMALIREARSMLKDPAA